MQFSDFAMLEREFETLDRGEARLNAMRDAVHEADVRQDLNWRFWFRYDYIEESIFCGDRYYALIMFPELLRLYEESPKLQEDSRCAHSMLVTFKWIVEAAPEFPQIPREEIDGYFREFRKQLRAQGKSLSAYYMKRSLFYMHVDMDIASMCFYRFLEEPLDDSSDGQALYYDQQAFYYLWVGAEEKALRAAQPIFDGKVRASSLPQATFHDFLRYYMNRGNFEEAERYGRMIEHRVNGDPYYHDIIGSAFMQGLTGRMPSPCSTGMSRTILIPGTRGCVCSLRSVQRISLRCAGRIPRCMSISASPACPTPGHSGRRSQRQRSTLQRNSMPATARTIICRCICPPMERSDSDVFS